MLYLITNEIDGTTETFTTKRAAYKAMTVLKRAGVHHTARVHDENGCRYADIDAVRLIKS